MLPDEVAGPIKLCHIPWMGEHCSVPHADGLEVLAPVDRDRLLGTGAVVQQRAFALRDRDLERIAARRSESGR